MLIIGLFSTEALLKSGKIDDAYETPANALISSHCLIVASLPEVSMVEFDAGINSD